MFPLAGAVRRLEAGDEEADRLLESGVGCLILPGRSLAALGFAPLVASHACAHAMSPSTRNLTDRQLDVIRDTDGVIGFNLAVYDVCADGHLDADTPLETVVRHIEYLIKRVGEDRLAPGSYFDGTTVPRQIKDASGLPHLFEAMNLAGFDQETISKFTFEN